MTLEENSPEQNKQTYRNEITIKDDMRGITIAIASDDTNMDALKKIAIQLKDNLVQTNGKKRGSSYTG